MKTLNYISFIQKYSVYSTCQIYAELATVHLQWLPKPTLGFPGGTSGKDPACQCRRLKRCGFDPWVEKIPWRKTQQPTPNSNYNYQVLIMYVLIMLIIMYQYVFSMHLCIHTYTHICVYYFFSFISFMLKPVWFRNIVGAYRNPIV